MAPKLLKQWRLSLDSERGRAWVTQGEAAARLSMPLRTYQDWESGRRRIPGSLGLACAAVKHNLQPYGDTRMTDETATVLEQLVALRAELREFKDQTRENFQDVKQHLASLERQVAELRSMISRPRRSRSA